MEPGSLSEGTGLPDGVRGRVMGHVPSPAGSPIGRAGSCQGQGEWVGRQKFRLLTSWELSKRKKNKTSLCQDSREMFADFLLPIDYFQLGFEANVLIQGLPGEGGELTALLLCFSRQPQTHDSPRMRPSLRRKCRELRRKQRAIRGKWRQNNKN